MEEKILLQPIKAMAGEGKTVLYVCIGLLTVIILTTIGLNFWAMSLVDENDAKTLHNITMYTAIASSIALALVGIVLLQAHDLIFAKGEEKRGYYRIPFYSAALASQARKKQRNAEQQAAVDVVAQNVVQEGIDEAFGPERRE